MGTIVDWKALLEGHASGFTVAVDGARIGDGIDAIPLDRVTAVEPETPNVQRCVKQSWTQDSDACDITIFDITDQGEEVEVPRERLLAELRRHGGRAHVDGVIYELAGELVGGEIHQIRIRGLPLETLPFAGEADIERALGPGIGIERAHGAAVHHFPERGISVAWDVEEERVEYVVLGPVEWKPPVFGARDVLQEWLAAALCGLAPAWEAPEDRASSEWVRHARVTALLNAFALGSPHAFAEGEFLEGRPASAYPRAAEVLQKAVIDSDHEVTRYPDALGRLFWWLLRYRTEAEHLLQINDTWLVASHPGILSAIEVTQQANRGVATALAEVDALLTEMIAPAGTQITERELIERWGWPEVDLDDLLADEF